MRNVLPKRQAFSQALFHTTPATLRGEAMILMRNEKISRTVAWPKAVQLPDANQSVTPSTSKHIEHRKNAFNTALLHLAVILKSQLKTDKQID